jgi:hypothetical protein
MGWLETEWSEDNGGEGGRLHRRRVAQSGSSARTIHSTPSGVYHRPESRVRENRSHGSAGGESGQPGFPPPIQGKPAEGIGPKCFPGGASAVIVTWQNFLLFGVIVLMCSLDIVIGHGLVFA